MKWTVFAFIFSLVFAYWNKGLLLYLLYTLAWEIVIFLLLRISPLKRIDIILSSILGYFIGSLMFYSIISWEEPKERNGLGKFLDTNVLSKVYSVRFTAFA